MLAEKAQHAEGEVWVYLGLKLEVVLSKDSPAKSDGYLSNSVET
jgi:hypothetical protein